MWRRPYLYVARFARLTGSTGFAGVWHISIFDWLTSFRDSEEICAFCCYQAFCGNKDVETFIPCFYRISKDSMTVAVREDLEVL